MPQKKDVLRIVTGDWHVGSVKGLCQAGNWQGQYASHIPRPSQQAIRAVFEQAMKEIKARRKGKQVEVVHLGDLIDGDHHSTLEIFTRNELEQAEIAAELVEEFKRGIGWERGDKLWILRGTESHSKDWESYVAEHTLAQTPEVDNMHAWDALEIETHGTVSAFVHHGRKPGRGANEGNTIRNQLRDIHIDHMKGKNSRPDFVHWAHVHELGYDTYNAREEFTFKTIHGIIIPPLQVRTRYGHQAAPLVQDVVGMVSYTIRADGTAEMPPVFHAGKIKNHGKGDVKNV